METPTQTSTTTQIDNELVITPGDNENVINNTQLPMDLEHEACLKQQLLKHAIQKEVDIFMDNPNCIHDLLFLGFIFNQMSNFPLLSSHPKAREKLEDFILTLPQFLIVSQRASKLDQQNKQLRVLVAATFHVNFKTPLEREEDRKMLQEDYSRKVENEEEENIVEPEDRMRRAYFDKGQHELAFAAETMFLDMGKEGGVARFFEVIKSTPKLADIPPIYQNFLRKLGKMMALNAEKNYTSKDQVSKLKRMYKLTPLQAIKGILAITNPVKLLSGLLSLFLTRPVGMQSLLQNMTSASVELKRSEKLLKSAKKDALTLLKRFGSKVGSEVLSHVTKYLQTHDLPLPDEEHYIINENGFKELSYENLYNVQFVLDAIGDKLDVTKLQRNEIDAIHQVILHEIRVQEKRDLVNMIGTEKVTSIIKNLWSVMDEPIALICRSNLGTHLERMLKGVRDIVKVSEVEKKATVEARLEAYNVVLQQIQDNVYLFIHDIVKRDTGVFQDTLQWYINILKCINGEPIDVQSLIRNCSEADQVMMCDEVHSMVLYQRLVKKGQKPTSKPLDKHLQKLVPEFTEMIRTILPQKTSDIVSQKSDIEKTQKEAL